MSLRAHNILLNPTSLQIEYFLNACGIARFAYNAGLYEYIQCKQKGEKVNWIEIMKKFRARIDSDYSFVRNATKSAPEYGMRDLQKSISRFFKTKANKKNKNLKFPKYRTRKKGIGSFGIANNTFWVKGNTLKIQRLNSTINMSQPLRFEGKIMSGRISEKSGKWYISILVEVDEESVSVNKNATGSVGIDTGLKTYMTLSDGTVYENQVYYKKSQHTARVSL